MNSILNIVTIWCTGSCRNSDIMKVVRALFFCCASHNISLLTEPIPGHNNTKADLLSRLQVAAFFEQHPLAVPNPAIPPAHIWEIWVKTWIGFSKNHCQWIHEIHIGQLYTVTSNSADRWLSFLSRQTNRSLCFMLLHPSIALVLKP